jgi:outer membrane protein assembly factor BamB
VSRAAIRILVLVALLSPLPARPLAAADADWPQWRGAARDGHVAALPSTMPSLKLLWKHPMAGECNAGIAVAGGRVFLADHDEKSDFYRCLDAETGTELWHYSVANDRDMAYDAAPRATPLVYRDKVYTLCAFGDLICFESKTGKIAWQKNLLKEFGVGKEPHWGYSSSPLIAGGKLIVNPGGKAALAALDPDTGNVLWQGQGGEANYSSFIAGTFGGVEQVVGFDEKSLGGWELATGKRLWSVEVEHGDNYIVPTPIAVGGKLFVTDHKNESQLFAFGKDGAIQPEPVAKSDEICPEVITPVVAGDLVLGMTKELVCLDAANDLNTLWTCGKDKDPAFTKDRPCHLIVAGSVALAFNSRGEMVLFQFDRKGPKILGHAKLCGRTLMHPTVAGTRLYVRDAEFLYCYDLTP